LSFGHVELFKELQQEKKFEVQFDLLMLLEEPASLGGFLMQPLEHALQGLELSVQ
jgi:hypothetical protein